MLRQKVQNPPLKPLQGIGVVLGTLLAAALGSMFFSRLSLRIGTLASVGFIVYGMAIAGVLLFRFVLAFAYEAGPDCLQISRVYGRYQRPMTDVWYNSVAAYGSLEDVKKRHPDAPVARATRAHCALEPFAMAHKSGGRIVVTVVQPDAAMLAFLKKQLKR